MTEENRMVWYNRGRNELKVQYCPDCDKYIFFPREICPYCLETTPEWKTTCGRGRIYSHTIVRRSALKEFEGKTPYIYAIIELYEGFRMPANIVQCPVDKIKIGLPVELAWAEQGEKVLPVFRPFSLY